MIIVSVKYAGVIMRAHNRGDGGIMALAALCSATGARTRHCSCARDLRCLAVLRRRHDHAGDLGPVGGLGPRGHDPGLRHLVVPISLAILIALFLLQRCGTGAVGWLFGPVMLVWFGAIGVLGPHQVLGIPGVLQALSPTLGARSSSTTAIEAFLTLGGVVLGVTGAEALYADRGHFGPGRSGAAGS